MAFNNKPNKGFDLNVFNTGSNPVDKPKNEFYLNVGIRVPMKNEDGEDVFPLVTLPIGIPLDGLKIKLSNSSNESWNKLQLNKKQLLEYIQEVASSLQKGEAVELEQMIVEIRRTKPEVEEPEEPIEDNFFKNSIVIKKK